MRARETNGAITFDPSIPSGKNLADIFRIFVDQSKISNHLALRSHQFRENAPYPKITIYTDGACLNNGKENAACGGGIWISPENPLNKLIRVPGQVQSNQIGEIAAIIIAMEAVPIFQPLEIVVDAHKCTTRDTFTF